MLFFRKLAAELGDHKLCLAFWINNINYIQSALEEHSGKLLEMEQTFYDELLQVKSNEFAIFTLKPHIGEMIEFVTKYEPTPDKIEFKKMQTIASRFNDNWKKALNDINSNTMQVFTLFQNGARVLHLILTTLVLWYKRFLSLWEKYVGTEVSFEPVGIQAVLVEIKKYKSAFK